MKAAMASCPGAFERGVDGAPACWGGTCPNCDLTKRLLPSAKPQQQAQPQHGPELPLQLLITHCLLKNRGVKHTKLTIVHVSGVQVRNDK